MSSLVKEEKQIVEWTKEEKKDLPPKYGCFLIYEKATDSQLKDPSSPTDAYIVQYVIDNQIFADLCRGKKVNIFDMYYDKFGPNVVKSIDWGYGKINPRLWGYKTPEVKKKR
jgi:hypothetical protein